MCTDKTGTLTEASLRVVDARARRRRRRATSWRARSAATPRAPRRATRTLEAVHAAGLAGDDAAARAAAQVPFSSRRRWSALELDGERLVLGAPEALLDARRRRCASARVGGGGRRPPRARARRRRTRRSRRPRPTRRCPSRCARWGSSSWRSGCATTPTDTVAFFAAEEVALKVVSGDSPATVGAIARDAGIPARSDALDGGALPDGDAALLEAVRRRARDRAHLARGQGARRAGARRGGRVRRHARRRRQRRARRSSRRGSRSPRAAGRRWPARSPTSCWSRGEFGEVPRMVHEGRQILRNIQRVARLFVTKALFTAFLLITIALPTRRLPAAAAAVHAHLVADDRRARVLPRARAVVRAVAAGGVPRSGRALLDPGRHRHRHRDPRRLPARPPRVRRDARGGADGDRRDRRHRGPGDRDRARGRAGPAALRGDRPVRADGARLRARVRDPGRARLLRSRDADRRDGRRLGLGSAIGVALLAVALRLVRD